MFAEDYVEEVDLKREFRNQNGQLVTKPIFYEVDGVEYVKLVKNGNRLESPVMRADERFHFVRDPLEQLGEGGRHWSAMDIWPEEYDRFLQKKERATGIPLSMIGVPDSLARSWDRLNIYSVEDLAAADDRTIKRMGPGSEKWAEKAAHYLKEAEAAAQFDDSATKADAQFVAMRLEIANLKAEKAYAENGEGDFEDLDDAALREIAKSGGQSVPPNIKREKLVKLAYKAQFLVAEAA